MISFLYYQQNNEFNPIFVKNSLTKPNILVNISALLTISMKSTKIQKQLRSKTRWGIVAIFTLIALSLSYDMPQYANTAIKAVNNTIPLGIPEFSDKDFSLGLDLQGGAHLIYQADTKDIALAERATSVEGVKDVIERRVGGIGVGEPNVQTTKIGEDYRIIVDLPGITDVNKAISMIGETPILEFKEENDEPARALTAEEEKEIETYNATAKQKAQTALNDIRLKKQDFAEVAKAVSEDQQSKDQGGYLGFLDERIASDLYNWGKDQKDGEVTKTLLESDYGYTVAQRISERVNEEKTSASHILICYLGSTNCEASITKEEARVKAETLREKVTADNFAALAKENSSDIFTAENGGELGGFGRGEMVPEFEGPVFDAGVGEILPVIETQFGYHIIMKTESPKEIEFNRVFVRKLLEGDILPAAQKWKTTQLSGKQLDRAEVVSDVQTGAIQVSLQFDDEGRELFKDLTEKHVGSPIAIFLDGEVLSSPVVQTPIRDGRAVITGNFNIQEAKLLAQRLNAGALPVPVDLVSQQAIGATLGAESLAKSLKAGIAGILFVMMFMLLVYRLPGLLSTITLTLYIALTLAIFKLIGVTLTLAGIAGFILSIGMAVDANVLIFERMKEELKDGKSLKGAIEEGFIRAWTSIRDGNLSTLITCVMLIWFGSSFVKGFAVTLFIGIFISMFSAITATKLLLKFVEPWFRTRGHWLFLGFKK